MVRGGQAGLAALVAVIMLLVVAISAAPAGASVAPGVSGQVTAPVIESAELRLWPEYDDPGILVIFSGQFAEGAPTPIQASFSLPSGARNIQATYQDAAGSLINRPFEVQDGRLVYELPTTSFHIEYYLDRAPSGEQRDINFTFEAPYAINALSVTVQQPARASGFTLTPASEEQQTGADDLTYYGFNRRNLASGEQLDIKASYTKTDAGLTAPQLAVAPPTEEAVQVMLTAAASGEVVSATGVTSASWLPWLLIGLGVVLLGAVLAYWLLSRRPSPAPSPVVASKPRAAQTIAPAPPKRSQIPAGPVGDAVSFCTNCGHALKPDDRFCAQCGAPRRS